MSATILSTGLKDALKYFEQLPEVATQAAVLAVNQIAGGSAIVGLKRQMRKEVAFPSGYLEDGRLTVVQKATRNSIEAIIRGRDRPTSLARFATGAPGIRQKGGVRVIVKPGQTRTLKSAFLIKLRNGNTGLAVRLKPGDTLQKSTGAVKLANNLYLLYGPSVDQVFNSVAEDQLPIIGENLNQEFLRQFARLARG